MDCVLYYVIEVSFAKPDQWRKFPHCLKKSLKKMKWGLMVSYASCPLIRFLIYLDLDPSRATIRTKEFHAISIQI